MLLYIATSHSHQKPDHRQYHKNKIQGTKKSSQKSQDIYTYRKLAIKLAVDWAATGSHGAL